MVWFALVYSGREDATVQHVAHDLVVLGPVVREIMGMPNTPAVLDRVGAEGAGYYPRRRNVWCPILAVTSFGLYHDGSFPATLKTVASLR